MGGEYTLKFWLAHRDTYRTRSHYGSREDRHYLLIWFQNIYVVQVECADADMGYETSRRPMVYESRICKSLFKMVA